MSEYFDFAIVVIFMAVTIIVGISQGTKITNIKEYALGNRNFSTGALVATLVATYASGGAFFMDLSRTYSDGLYYIVPTLAWPIGFLLLGYVFVPRMAEFLGITSIAEAMGILYDKRIRIITAMAGIFSSIGYIAVQFKVFGSVISYFSGISTFEGILIAATVVTLYSAIGGIKAVTFTDVVQSLTFGVAIPVMGVMIWNHAYLSGFSFDNVTKHTTNFSLTHVFNTSTPGFWSMIFLFIYFSLPIINPDSFQRISMGRNITQVRRVFIICAVILLTITLATQWIPFLLYNIDNTIDSNDLLGYMVNNYTFIGFKGLVISGVLALSMSSADSVINSCAVLFANDICKPLKIGFNRELLISKYFSIMLGIGGVILANNSNDILNIILTASSFYVPTVYPVIMLAVLGFRSTTKSVLIGMIIGSITILSLSFNETAADPVIIAMILNLIFFIGSHYMLKQQGGWVGIKGHKELEKLKEMDEQKYQQKIKQLESEKRGLIAFCKKHAPKSEIHYIYLGVYMIIYAITTMYLTQYELSRFDTNYFILTIYQIILVSGIALIMYPLWPNIYSKQQRDNLANILWCSVIFIMLIVFNTFFAIITHFNGLQLSIFTVNLLIVSVLMGWNTSIWMILIGFFCGIVLHNYYDPLYTLDVTVGSPGFIMSYVSLLIGATLMLFLKPKEEYLEKTEAKVDTLENEVTHLDHELVDLTGQVTTLNKQVGKLTCKVSHYSQRVTDHEREIERLGSTAQKILNNVNHELRLPIGNVVNFSDMLHETLQKSDDKMLKDLSEEVFKNSTRVSSMILNMLDLATLEVKKVDLNKQTINFGELVTDRVKRCRKIYLQGKKIDFELSIQPEVMIAVDPDYIRQMVDNLVINSLTYSNEGTIYVYVYKAGRRVELVIEDQGIGIPLKDIYDIFDPFKIGSKTDSKAEGRGIGLALCKSVAEAHGGSITAESDGQKGAKFTIVLPY